MSSKAMNDFFKTFYPESYNRLQFGNDKNLIIKIYEYLEKINIDNKDINTIISNIAYLKTSDLNLPLYLELMSKSLGFTEQNSLDNIIKVVKQIHDIYFKYANNIPLDEYIHETEDVKIRKLFLNQNNKYILKTYSNENTQRLVADLKFATAIALEQKEYQDFVSFIDEYEKYQETYSPLLLFRTYTKVRKELKNDSKLFWDILFGNEYLVSLIKNGISINQIYKTNVFKQKEKKYDKIEQLDLFTYQDVSEENFEEIKTFQIITIYNASKLPTFEKEKDIIYYYRMLQDNKEKIDLPKLKGNGIYAYNIQK